MDPLDQLWYHLGLQDEELIYSENCQLQPPDIEPKNERISGQLLHFSQQRGVPYDYVPEVHAYARIIEKNLHHLGQPSRIITKNLIL